MRILQIVPRLPPAIDGLGDYALQLALELSLSRQWQTTFIVGDPAWNGSADIQGFEVRKVQARQTGALLETLEGCGGEPACVVLHYVNYGYEKRGCPLWLVNDIERWAGHASGRRLLTIFHELYADGPPWKSEFWLSSVQVHLAKRLHRSSHVSVTSNVDYSSRLASWERGKKIVVMPVFSNVGEPEHIPPLSGRSRMGVIFGGRESRRRVYARDLRPLIDVCERFGIEEICDVGPRLDVDLKQIGPARLTQMGELSGELVSELLLRSVAGIFDYAPGFWAKSGIFAAYCAHGVIPICMRPAKGERDGITDDMYWLAGAGRRANETQWHGEGIAAQARRWYLTHTRRECAEKLASIVRG